MSLTLSFNYFCHIPKRIALPGRKDIYGVKSLMLNGLSWAVAAIVAYFIIRQWYVWGAFVILMVIDFVRTSALRYQFAIVDDDVIRFRSLLPWKKQVVIKKSAGAVTIKRANSFSWLVAGSGEQAVRLQMHSSEVRALTAQLVGMGMPVSDRITADVNSRR